MQIFRATSYLLVESLDRLSRQSPRRAVRTLERICEEGITVVTLDDQRIYTLASLDQDPTSLLVAILVAVRAHEESATKARRLREVWGAKRSAAATKPLTRIAPAWVRLRDDRSAFDLIPERAEIVRRIFQMTLDGIGQHAIASALVREGVPVFGRGQFWQRSYVSKILSNPATMGEFTPHRYDKINGKSVRTPTEPVPNYYPAVIDRETFERVSGLTSARAAKVTSAGAVQANILSGLAKCPACGGTMTRINKGAKRHAKPYLVCTSAKVGAGCAYHQVRLENVHAAILDKAPELVADMPSPDDNLQTQWDALEGEIWGLEEGVGKIVEAISEGGHSRALLNRLSDLESLLETAKGKREELGSRITSTQTNRVQTVAREELIGAIEAENLGRINVTLRQLFERIVVDYRTGYLEMHWKHAPGETSSIFFAMPSIQEGN